MNKPNAESDQFKPLSPRFRDCVEIPESTEDIDEIIERFQAAGLSVAVDYRRKLILAGKKDSVDSVLEASRKAAWSMCQNGVWESGCRTDHMKFLAEHTEARQSHVETGGGIKRSSWEVSDGSDDQACHTGHNRTDNPNGQGWKVSFVGGETPVRRSLASLKTPQSSWPGYYTS